MISTERLAQITALMSANLPLATHGPNAFDAATKITVADVYGLIAAAQVGLTQPAAPAPVQATVDTVVQALAAFSPADRQAVYLELAGMEKLAAEEQSSTNTEAQTRAEGQAAPVVSQERDDRTGASVASTTGAGTDNPPASTGDGAGTEALGSVPAAAEGTGAAPAA